MVLYRRNRVAGGTYFFTVTVRDRSSDVLVRHVDLLRDAFRSVRAERPFTIDAIVILPEHLHTVWTLPEDDADYSGRWRAIKIPLSTNMSDVTSYHSTGPVNSPNRTDLVNALTSVRRLNCSNSGLTERGGLLTMGDVFYSCACVKNASTSSLST